MCNGVIPYDSLTYGQLGNFINQEALNLCSLIKVNATIKKDLKTSKRELGSFYAQYRYENPLPPSAKQERYYRSKKKRLNKKYSNFKEESYYRRPKHKKHSNKKYQNSSSKKIDKQDIKCFKYGKRGHITPNCKVKEIIADLDVGKCLKHQMINLIKTESQLKSSNQTFVETSDEDQYCYLKV